MENETQNTNTNETPVSETVEAFRVAALAANNGAPHPFRMFAPKDKQAVNDMIARRVIHIVSAGLSDGIGNDTIGHMCVEAAVCYAYGLGRDDAPPCVHPYLRSFKIAMNDAPVWNDAKDRAEALKRIALMQLGTKEHLDFGL